MDINQLQKRPGYDTGRKNLRLWESFGKLLEELRKKEIPDAVIEQINQEVDKVNTFTGSGRDYLKLLQRSRSEILRLVEKELNLVPRKHYLTRWLALGMAVFGVPLGVALGAGLHNMAFIGTGIPIGMVIGMALGAVMDKKAAEEGRQLDIEVNM